MLFDTTVRRELARTFGATLVVILTIVLTMMLIRTLGQAAGGAVSPQDVVLLLGYIALGHLPTMLALSLFVTVVVSLGRMYRDSEMAIWFSSGIGVSRFVRPVLATGAPVLVVIGALVLYVWPWGNRMSNELRDSYQQRSDLSRVAPGVFQTSADGSRVFFVERDDTDATAARNVFVLAQQGERESVTSARNGHLDTQDGRRMLVLERGQRNEIDAESGERSLARFDTYSVVVSERVVERAQDRPPRELGTHALLSNPLPRYQGELVWRFGLLLGAANMLLLAIGLSATNPRRASNWNLLFALLGFVVYYNLITLTQAWVGGGRISMGVALLGLHGGAFALALTLIWWRDHAAVMRPWSVRGRRAAASAQAGKPGQVPA
jgi:lipopolysaccharide export system permease protein